MRTHPDRVGKYRILRMLGEGGMGTVYLAEHEFLGVRRAVKVLLPELAVQPGARQRFIDEARILVRLAHPNIVQVHDMDADGDCLYIAMDFVSPDGEHTVALDHHLEAKGRRLPAGEAAALMAQVLRAVDFAHSRKVIHRDIKPANLLLDRGGVVRVSDFGLARIAGNAFFTHVQQSQSMMADSLGAMATFDPSLLAAVTPADENSTGAQETYHGNTAGDTAGAAAAARAVGTPHFMPPEVLNRTGEWSEKGDIYSLGVLACLMVTGNYPIGQYRSPHAFDAAIPLVWDELVERALQQAPADRFASAREMLDLLLEAYPLLGDDAGRAGATRHTTAGDVPESAVLMVRDFVTRQKARWDRDVWTDFVIDFYRTPGHTAVTKDQVGQLAEKEKLEWLEREARRRDEEVKRAEELAQRQREAEETRRRLELERKAQPHRDLAREAGQAGRWTEALDAWNAVLRLMPDDAETRRCRDEAGRIGAKPMEDEAVRLFQEHRYDEAAELLARVELLIPGNESVSRRRTEAKNRAALISRNISQAERLGPGHNREVLALCKAVLEIDPDNMRASELYLRALSCIKAADRDTIEAKRLCHLKKFSGALSLLQQVVINDPESEEIKTLVTAAKEALTSASDCVQKGKAALQS
ncbi:MAG: protein kinase, partial [Candidatus Sumerlaeota bacterium]|nr:protein kinase [Candidatus Sumerlaeota bacterium]